MIVHITESFDEIGVIQNWHHLIYPLEMQGTYKSYYSVIIFVQSKCYFVKFVLIWLFKKEVG